MNKYIFYFLITFFTITVNFAFCQSLKFSIVGNIPSLKSEKVVLSVYDINTAQYNPLDSVVAKQGKFTISRQITEPKLYWLYWGDHTEQLFIGNENIVITEDSSLKPRYIIKGSALTDQFNDYNTNYVSQPRIKMIALSKEMADFDQKNQHGLDSLQNIFNSASSSVLDSTENIFVSTHLHL